MRFVLISVCFGKCCGVFVVALFVVSLVYCVVMVAGMVDCLCLLFACLLVLRFVV